MSSLSTTLNHITAILSFEVDTNTLETNLSKDSVNWEHIVKVASSHLVLTTLFCRLKQRSLLHVLPKELETYLEELTTINRNRNATILEEVKALSALLNTHNINHVFLKGSALLSAGYYSDFSERLIGDVDILILKDEINKAYSFLQTNGFEIGAFSTGYKFSKKRHLDRLVPINGLAAIELHFNLLTEGYKNFLNPKALLKTKQIINGIPILTDLELLNHNVLNYQINDKGNFYKTFSLRSAYDTLLILRHHQDIDFQNVISDSAFKNYFLMLKPLFRDIPKIPLTALDHLKLKYNAYKLKYKLIGFINTSLIRIHKISTAFAVRILLFIRHSEYRQFAIQRILKQGFRMKKN